MTNAIPTDDPWAVHVSRFRILLVHVTAMPLEPPGTDLVVLPSLTVVVEEGPYEALREDGRGAPAPSVLEYGCYIQEEGLPPVSSWVGTYAHIVVADTHENGWSIILAGLGAIGRDEAGGTEIVFEGAPNMMVIDPGDLHAKR